MYFCSYLHRGIIQY